MSKPAAKHASKQTPAHGVQDGAGLRRIESFQYPSAHVGHLSPNQQAALDKFKALCKSKKYYEPASDQVPASHDDETLLRYLRARKFVPKDAFVQFKDTEDWRKENKLDQLYETIDIEEYEQTRRLYPQWTGRRDKRGIPVYVFEVGHLNSKAVSDYESSTSSKNKSIDANAKVPVKMLRLFALYENLCRFVLPLCSVVPDRPHPETPISQSNNIVDISHVGLKQFWNLKNHMQDASTLATAHYPETLDRIFIIGAPPFFPTVWGWIKRWFDPITVSKIFVLSHSTMKATLEQYIEPQNFPKKYGGQLDFKFGDTPILEPAIAGALQWKEEILTKGGHMTIPSGPIKWQEDDHGDLVAVACGSEKGQPRKKVLATIHIEPNVARTSLSPGRVENPQAQIYRTTTGLDTHPPTPLDEVTDRSPSQVENLTTSGTANAIAPSDAALSPTNRADTMALPHRNDNLVTSPEAGEQRQGTSSTRFEQQDQTHAQGQLEEGTPAIRDNSEGDKHAVMEPGTVGQAPKEHPVPEPEVPQTSYLDQAKGAAGQAYEKALQVEQQVLSAVGYGSKELKEEPAIETNKDPQVDGMPNRDVEEFLRSQNKSTSVADHR